jgi:hypothetical protein
MTDKMKVTFIGGPFDGEEIWEGESKEALQNARSISRATMDLEMDDDEFDKLLTKKPVVKTHIRNTIKQKSYRELINKMGKARWHLYYITGLGDNWSIWTYDKSFDHKPTTREHQEAVSKSPIKGKRKKQKRK